MRSIISLLLLGALLTSCDPPVECPSGYPMVRGTIRDYTGLDGCAFVIELANGEVVEPGMVHDSTFVFEDGKKVWFSYRSLPAASVCMVGEVVEVLCIQ
jgi:hypothetical protein